MGAPLGVMSLGTVAGVPPASSSPLSSILEDVVTSLSSHIIESFLALYFQHTQPQNHPNF